MSPIIPPQYAFDLNYSTLYNDVATNQYVYVLGSEIIIFILIIILLLMLINTLINLIRFIKGR